MSFFVMDLETIGIESTSVVLSAAFVYVDIDNLPSDPTAAYKQLLADSCFVKFKSKEQSLPPYNRTVDLDTLQWWKRQGEYQRKMALIPSEIDVGVVEGAERLRAFFKSKPSGLPVWVRGSLDQPVFQSLLKSFSIPSFIEYNCYRDVRTAIDLIYPGAKSGYVDIDGFDSYQVIKHHPTHDCAYDGLQLIFGNKTE